jgi:xanthine/CO dehydrogenase XdhC/CoxF family maturation factor
MRRTLASAGDAIIVEIEDTERSERRTPSASYVFTEDRRST